jgi:hypothetical protein
MAAIQRVTGITLLISIPLHLTFPDSQPDKSVRIAAVHFNPHCCSKREHFCQMPLQP